MVKKRVPLYVDAYAVGEAEVDPGTDFVFFSTELMSEEARNFLLPKPITGWLPRDNKMAEYVCGECGNRVWVKLPFTPNPEKVPCVRPACLSYCGPNNNYVSEKVSNEMESFYEAMEILGINCNRQSFWLRYQSDPSFQYLVNAAWRAWEAKSNPPRAPFNLNEKPPWLKIDHL